MVRAKGLVRLEVCLWTVMAGKRYKPEEIVAKLRQVDVLVSQGARTHSPVVQGGCWAEPPIMAGKSRQRASESPRSQGSPSSTSSSRGMIADPSLPHCV